MFWLPQVLAKLKPKHLKVVGTMAMVRNSVGSGENDITHGVSQHTQASTNSVPLLIHTHSLSIPFTYTHIHIYTHTHTQSL